MITPESVSEEEKDYLRSLHLMQTTIYYIIHFNQQAYTILGIIKGVLKKLFTKQCDILYHC